MGICSMETKEIEDLNETCHHLTVSTDIYGSSLWPHHQSIEATFKKQFPVLPSALY
jgi:hypothetical protein